VDDTQHGINCAHITLQQRSNTLGLTRLSQQPTDSLLWQLLHMPPAACPHLSLSLNTRMEVLYTLMARSTPSAVLAWYTLASLPVDTQPLISWNRPLGAGQGGRQEWHGNTNTHR
jgi:hypothetical protein